MPYLSVTASCVVCGSLHVEQKDAATHTAVESTNVLIWLLNARLLECKAVSVAADLITSMPLLQAMPTD